MAQRNGLFRSRTNRVLGGVCGGLAYNLNSDPSLIRIIFLLLTVFWGGGAILYLILWIALPEDDYPFIHQPGAAGGPNDAAADPVTGSAFRVPAKSSGPLMVGLILIAVGAIFLIARFVPHLHFGDLWPIVLVAAGLVLIAGSFTKTKNSNP